MKSFWFKQYYLIVSISLAVLLFLICRANIHTFPFPWNDEVRFYLPALWWAEYFSFYPEYLNAPNGIYWVPDGFTVIIGSFLKIFAKKIEIARLVCEFSVVIGFIIYAVSFKKLTQSSYLGGISALLLLSPPVIFAANMVRMEAIIFLIIAMALYCHSHDRWISAASLLIGGILIHPAISFSAAAYCIVMSFILINNKIIPKIRFLDGLLVLFVVLAFSLEFIHIASNFNEYKLHMAYQFARKLGTPLKTRLFKPQGAILSAFLFITVTFITYSIKHKITPVLFKFLPVVVIGLGLCLYGVLGFEMAYNIYSVVTGPAIIFCAFSIALFGSKSNKI